MKRLQFRWTPVRGFIAGIVCTLLLEAGVVLLIGGAGVATQTYKIDQVAVSESGGWRAVLYSRLGGGAAGWCVQEMMVERDQAPVPTDKAPGSLPRKESALSTDCGTNVRLAWIGPRELQVEYRLAANTSSRVELPQSAAGGAVHLTYVLLQD